MTGRGCGGVRYGGPLRGDGPERLESLGSSGAPYLELQGTPCPGLCALGTAGV